MVVLLRQLYCCGMFVRVDVDTGDGGVARIGVAGMASGGGLHI